MIHISKVVFMNFTLFLDYHVGKLDTNFII